MMIGLATDLVLWHTLIEIVLTELLFVEVMRTLLGIAGVEGLGTVIGIGLGKTSRSLARKSMALMATH